MSLIKFCLGLLCCLALALAATAAGLLLMGEVAGLVHWMIKH